MNRYVIRTDWIVEAESEDEAINKYARNEAHYDGIYEVEVEEQDIYDEDEDEDEDEEEEA